MKKGRSIWDARVRARGGKTLSMPNTKGSAGHSGSFELATERITQRTAEQRIFLR